MKTGDFAFPETSGRKVYVLCPGKAVTPETVRCMEILEALLADGGQGTEQR